MMKMGATSAASLGSTMGSIGIGGESQNAPITMRASVPRDSGVGFISKNEMAELLEKEYSPDMLEQ